MDKRNIDVVLVRMDKMGDLVVSLPCDQHPALRGQRVHWLITRGLSFVAEQSTPKRLATEFSRKFSWLEFFRLIGWFKRQNPRTLILLHSPWWVSLAGWLAGIPERMGRVSQWHSFLFLNVGVRQSRKGSVQHESDYNFDLIEQGYTRLGNNRTANLSELKKSYLHLNAPNPAATLESRGLKAREFRVVHPGMGGSALNWPADSFRDLIGRLAADRPVVITGTTADQRFLAQLENVRQLSGVHWFVNELKPFELLDVLSQARSVVAPSTGVLHLAASLGTPVVGIYSPRTVERPERWGPKGPACAVLTPQVQDPDHMSPEVMREISPSEVQLKTFEVEKVKSGPTAFPSPTA